MNRMSRSRSENMGVQCLMGGSSNRENNKYSTTAVGRYDYLGKKLGLSLTLSIKINSRSIKELKVKNETFKVLEKRDQYY